MRNVRWRLARLERLPQFQPPPSLLEQIRKLALDQVSDEDLALMINMASDRDKGVCRTLLPTESAALASHQAALDVEAQRMGFKSYAHAERRTGGRR